MLAQFPQRTLDRDAEITPIISAKGLWQCPSPPPNLTSKQVSTCRCKDRDFIMMFEEYERTGRASYEAFAQTVAAILTAAIEAAGNVRLQQVRSRAKDVKSLRRKLEIRSKTAGRDLLAIDRLEEEIKDLAGARVVVYTDTDADRLGVSPLFRDNFEILDVKLHHPRRGEEDASALYVSSHVIVALRAERLALPEYARFAGLRCEVQIQTILNHAWAEMAHDTIYKEPPLDGFGTEALNAIKARMRRIARKYLRPAGYEFAKVSADFDQLMKGAALFKAATLDTIVDAKDNNQRDEALDTFIENVLPFYDDLEGKYPEILAKLGTAVERARKTKNIPIETTFVTLAPRTTLSIVRRVAEIVDRYHLLNPGLSIDLVLKLYPDALDDEERKRLIEAGVKIARQDLRLSRKVGPLVQLMVADRIEAMSDRERQAALPLLVALLRELLNSETTSYTGTMKTVMLERGAVIPSDQLSAMRAKAIGFLKILYPFAQDDELRWAILSALNSGARPPHLTGYGPELVVDLMTTAAESMAFHADVAREMSFDLRQKSEYAVLDQFRVNRHVPAALLERVEVQALQDRIDGAIVDYRSILDADVEYGVYKTLVGHQAVMAPAWDQERFGYRETEAYRKNQVAQFVEELNEVTCDLWYQRVLRCAVGESRSPHGISIFTEFLEQAARTQPGIVLTWLRRLNPALVPFFPHLLGGLQLSARAEELDPLVSSWIEEGRCLPEIAWFLRLTSFFSEETLRCVLDRAMALDDRDTVSTCMGVAARRFGETPGTLIDSIFMSGLAHMTAQDDRRWVRSGYYAWLHPDMLKALSEGQAQAVLDALLDFEAIDDFAEHIMAAIAAPWPVLALRFFRRRVGRDERKPRIKGYEAVPYSIDELQEPLSQLPDLVLTEAEAGFDEEPHHFEYRMGKFVTALFPEIDGEFADQLRARIARDRTGIRFVLAILNSYGGASLIEPIMREVVGALEPGDKLLDYVAAAFAQNNTVMGQFGFTELAEMRIARMQEWRDSSDARLQAFARGQIPILERQLAAETSRAEADAAAQLLGWGEDLHSLTGDEEAGG